MERWQSAYRERKFSIDSNKPSKVVAQGFERLVVLPGFRALDLGCGNGRNSVFAAILGGGSRCN
jgi:cyclopropane fatty-acyl-phospholipid synthase-like methyltransferase